MIHAGLLRTFDRVTSSKDRRPIYEWGAENVTLFPPLTRTGPLDVSGSRHFLTVFDWLQDDAIREVNVMAPVRSGKTLIGDSWLPWTVMNDPGPFRIVMQDDQVAHEQVEARTMKTLKAVPGIDLILPTSRHKDREMEIIFPSGHNLYIGGPSLGKLQSKGFRYVWVSEPWLPSIKKHFAEIKGRLGDFLKMQTSKLFCESQGGEDGDPWDLQSRSGEWNEWMVECQNCRVFIAAEFMGYRPDGSRWGIVWDKHKDARGRWDIAKCLPTVRFECRECGHPHIDSPRLKDNWNRTGRYDVIGEHHRSKKTAHWSFVIDFPWVEAVDLWLQARNAWRHSRDITQTVAFWQKRVAVCRNARSAQEAGSNFKREVYEIDADCKTPGEIWRSMEIDRQSEDVFWVRVTTFSAEGECRRLHFGKCFSFVECEAVREKFKTPSNRTFIDSGYRPKGDNGVYAACIRYGWLAVKGVGGVYSFTHVIKNRNGIGKRVQRSYAPLSHGDSETVLGNCKLVRFSASAMSDKVKGLIDGGKMIEPMVTEGDPLDAEYKRQMAGDVQVPRRNRFGQVEMVWETVDDNNHAWDLAKIACLGATLGRILPDHVEESRETEAT